MSILDPAAGTFHFDKRIPVALIITLLAQTAGVVWWAATLQAAQAKSEMDLRRLEVQAERFDVTRMDLSTRVIRIEEKLSSQSDTLQRILRSVERDANR